MYSGIEELHKRQYVRYGIVTLLLLCLIGIGLWFGRFYMSDSRLSVFPTFVTMSETPISFEVAVTGLQQQRGLSGRKNIPANYGMLFVFPKDDLHGIWMKDMLTPIDIIWLSDTGTILSINELVEPSTYPFVFYPNVPARYVLEMRAGQSNARGWKVGTKVSLPLPYAK